MQASPISFALGSDHQGIALKKALIARLEARNIPLQDMGSHSESSVDYSDFAEQVVKSIENGESTRGVLICSTGIGMSMAANRSKKIRAALCHTLEETKLTRQHNDANILVLGARSLSGDLAVQMLDAFIDTAFEGGRHQRRIDKFS